MRERNESAINNNTQQLTINSNQSNEMEIDRHFDWMYDAKVRKDERDGAAWGYHEKSL